MKTLGKGVRLTPDTWDRLESLGKLTGSTKLGTARSIIEEFLPVVEGRVMTGKTESLPKKKFWERVFRR